jgi:hypothetical protein
MTSVLAAAGLLLLVISCESVLFIELEESEKLIVVNAALTDNTYASVQVSRTRHILDNAPLVPLDKATVRLYEEGSLVQVLPHTGQGHYVSQDFVPATGRSYTVEVEHAGYPAVTALCVVPESIPIAGLDTSTVTMEQQEDYYWGWDLRWLQFDLTLQDPAGEENYYLLNLRADRSYTEWRDTTVKVVDSLYYGNQWNYFLEDSTYTIYDIHRFEDQPYLETDDIVVEAETSKGILFSDQLIDGESYSLRFRVMEEMLTSADSAVVDIRLHSISESYYRYLKSRQKHYDTKENPLVVPVIVYSNVEFGTGFFGGYSTDQYRITTFIPEYWMDYYRYYPD